MNGPSAVNSAHRNPAVRRAVVVAQVAAVGKVEAVPVVSEVAQAAKVVDARAAKAEADVRVASAVWHRAQGRGHKLRPHNKTPRLLAHGGCGSG